MTVFRILLLGLMMLGAQMGVADTNSLFQSDTFRSNSASLVQVGQDGDTRASTPSLFIGKGGDSFFAPFPVRTRKIPSITLNHTAQIGVVGLRNVIGQAESRRDGYDAVQHGARIRPTKPPTQMTIGEIYAWIDATPGQPHAIGRFQFIPVTLRRVVREVGFGRDTRFTPAVQDKLADVLLKEAGLQRFNHGLIGRHQFMNNLAKIWAGLPTSNGKSHYDGYAGNKAAMTWTDFDAHMRRIFES